MITFIRPIGSAVAGVRGAGSDERTAGVRASLATTIFVEAAAVAFAT